MVFKSPCSGRAAMGAVLFIRPLSFKNNEDVIGNTK
jgi:hypothetical protein